MSTKKDYEIPGNAMGSAALHQRMLMSSGEKLHMLSYGVEQLAERGVRISKVTLKCGADPRGSWLAVVTAVTAEGPIVAFHSGEGLLAVVEGLSGKIRNGGLKWREDEYANGTG